MIKRRMKAVSLGLCMALAVSACGSEPATENTATESPATEAATTAATEASSGDAGGVEEAVLLKGEGPATLDDLNAVVDTESGISDGDVIVDINFDDNDTTGFGSFTNGGDYVLSAADGQLVCDIAKCGDLDYANQVYYDGLELSHGCVYTYSFDISSDIDRKVEYRLQLNGGDYHAYCSDYIDVTTDVQNISVDFEMNDVSDPAPRLCFNMGKMEDMTADPGQHKVYIDNIKLVVKDASNAQAIGGLPNYVSVAVNQLGYKPDDKKYAIVKDDNVGTSDFIVCDAATNKTVFDGGVSDYIYDEGADLNVKVLDFSDLTEPGEYYVVTDKGASYPFVITDNPYAEAYKDVVMMLYRQRCGIAIDGDFGHPECHMDKAVVYDNRSVTKDVTGGWHDAGDYGRYIVSGAEAVADIMLAYEDFKIEDDDWGIPESGNGIPDILDEARYELDWMLKMQDETTGGVYHKVTGLNFPGTVNPDEETDTMYLMPISFTATGDFAAVMAKASVLYKDIDPEFSEKAYAAAEKAWNYIADEVDLAGFKNPEDVDTGEYPDRNTKDEKYWAAAELYIAGRTDLEPVVKELRADGRVFPGLGWLEMTTYADYDLAKYVPDSEVGKEAKKLLLESADEVVGEVAESGYFTGMKKYPWGSNMTVANHAELLLMAHNLTGDDKYIDTAKKQLDYLFGINPLGYCYISGYGTLSPEQPHHRPSQVAGKAVPGMLAGGPNGGLEDPFAQTVLSGQSPAMCYIDNMQSYATNEVAIYWNSPLIYAMSGLR